MLLAPRLVSDGLFWKHHSPHPALHPPPSAPRTFLGAGGRRCRGHRGRPGGRPAHGARVFPPTAGGLQAAGLLHGGASRCVEKGPCGSRPLHHCHSPAGRQEPSPHHVTTGQGPLMVTQRDSCTLNPVGRGSPHPSFLDRETEAQSSGSKHGNGVAWPVSWSAGLRGQACCLCPPCGPGR